MKCPNCDNENPADNRFCRECGGKLSTACAKCMAEVLPGDKFCGKCGHELTAASGLPSKDLSFDDKLNKIQRYLPKGLTEKILSQRDKIEGERKQVTVMFCDMEGFTALVGKLGPEEAYAVMDRVYEILIHKVHDYEGTVNEMTGDGIMALFGAPIAIEDAPQRAIRSAYAIHREMTKFNQRLQEDVKDIAPVKMRIGIHTGPVVVGTLGNDLRVEFKAVGETVNLASRMEAIAEPGATFVSEATFGLAEGFFRFEALGKKEFKGKEEPVRVYRAIAPSTSRTRFDVSAERGLTPFVGRERELELLLDAFERAKSGRGQAVSIMSEAGVGKSRLLYEFRKAVANEDITFLEGKCLSYSKGVAYHPVIDILKGNFDVLEKDGEAEIREKVTSGLNTLGLDEYSIHPYFLELLSVKDSGIDTIPMSPEAKKDRIMEALRRIVLKGSEIRPLVLAYEDLHWMDKSSEDVLTNLLHSIPGARILLILTYRPDFVRAWGAKSYHNQITLNKLSNRESLTLIYHFLGTEAVESHLEDLILEKTEGVPFFIEEFVKSLRELKIIDIEDGKYALSKNVRELTIPSTIHDVIMARIDSLPEPAKKVLQIGSVIEREFSYELIKQVIGLPEKELLSQLSVLKDSELLYERGIYPQSTYIFKHALTQEVVNDSILIKKKGEYHNKIASAIEDLYQENLDDHYEILTEHYIRSENYTKGAEYSRLARKKALRTGSVTDGIAYGEETVACLEKLPPSKDVLENVIKARTILGFHFSQINYHIEAKEAIDPIVNRALMSDDKRRQSQILTILGTHSYMVEEDFPKAIAYLEKALQIAHETGDIASLVQAEFWLGVGLSINCQYQEGLGYLKRALKKSLSVNSLWGASVAESNISCFVYYFQGKLDKALQHSLKAIELAEESDDIYSKTIAYSCHAFCCFGKGVFSEAKRYFLKGIELAERIGYFLWGGAGNIFLGEIYSEVGDYKAAEDHFKKGVLLMKRSKSFRCWSHWGEIALANAQIVTKGKGRKLEVFCEYVRLNRVKLLDGILRRCLSQVLLHHNDGRISDAEDWIKQAIAADKKNGMRFELGMDYLVYWEISMKKGSKKQSLISIQKAMEIFGECGADGWAGRTEERMAKLL